MRGKYEAPFSSLKKIYEQYNNFKDIVEKKGFNS